MRLNSSLQTNEEVAAEATEATEATEDTTVVELEVLEEEEDNSAISRIRDQLLLKQKTMHKMQLLDKKNRLYRQP